MLTVAEIMTREPYTLGPDDTLATARQLLAAHHIRHIPVVSADGSLIGLVSQRDVLAAGDTSVLNREGGSSRENYVALSSIMSSPVQSVDESASLRGTALHLQKHKVGCLPVLRKGRLVGIITDSDFVAIAINLMEQLESVEPEDMDFDEEDEEIS
ncbi:MAG: CBS domain-containing protein [Halieaceae bacterium]|jgi:CBS domain-containing protein|nr:CBS domain-containing protein [Halieaceae bacterium]